MGARLMPVKHVQVGIQDALSWPKTPSARNGPGLSVHNAPIMDSGCPSKDHFAAFKIQSISAQ